MAVPFSVSHNLSASVVGSFQKPGGVAVAAAAVFADPNSDATALQVQLPQMKSGIISLGRALELWCDVTGSKIIQPVLHA